MGENAGNGATKVTDIRQIVRLKEFLQKWQSVALTSPKAKNTPQDPSRSPGPVGIPPAVNRRLMALKVTCDSDEEICLSPEHPSDVPKGYLAVCVGQELRRFIIPTSYLSHRLFKVLLEKAEEEHGFDHDGTLTLPCGVETFKNLLKCMESHRTRDQSDENKSIPETPPEIMEE